MAYGHKGEVFVVHVSADGPPVSSLFSPDTMTLRWGETPEAQANVDDAVRTVVSLGVPATSRVYTQVESIGREFVDTSRSLQGGLVAVGSGHRGRYGAVLLGGVSRFVVHRADGSVPVASSSCIDPSSFGRILMAVDGSMHALQAAHASFDCQLVVVGSHSRGRPGSMLGGAASKMLRSARLPVLVAR